MLLPPRNNYPDANNRIHLTIKMQGLNDQPCIFNVLCFTSLFLFLFAQMKGICSAADHIGHIIKTGRMACQELRSSNRSFSENGPRIRRMFDLDHLIFSGKYGIVYSDNRTAPKRGDADFLRI